MCTTHRKQMLLAGCASGLCPFSPRFLKEKKEHRKPVRWYTRLIVYGNPGRVVNGYAPGIPVLICGFSNAGMRGAVLVLVPLPTQGCDRCAPSYAPTGEPTLSGAPLSPCFAAESTREGTLMSLPEGAPARSGSGAKSGSLSSYPENAAAPAR